MLRLFYYIARSLLVHLFLVLYIRQDVEFIIKKKIEKY